MSLLLGALLLLGVKTNAQAGDVFLEDFEQGDTDMPLPDDRDGSAGDKAGWYRNDELDGEWDSGWGLNNEGTMYYDEHTPYEGQYCALSQMYTYSGEDNNTLYFYIDLSSDGYSATDNVWIDFWYSHTNYQGYYSYARTTLEMWVHDDDTNRSRRVWVGDVTNTEYYPVPGSGEDKWKHASVDISDHITSTYDTWTEIYFTHKTTSGWYAYPYMHHAKIDNLEFDIKEATDFAITNMTATPAAAEVNTTCAVKAALSNDGYADYPSGIVVDLIVEDDEGTVIASDTYTHSAGLDAGEWTWVWFNWTHVSSDGSETYNVTVTVDMAADTDDVDDAITKQVQRYWQKWWEGFESHDLKAPRPALSPSWYVSERIGDQNGDYSDGGIGVSSDSQYSWPSGYNDPYEGSECAIHRVLYDWYDSGAQDIWMDAYFDMESWGEVAFSFWYDTYIYTWYQQYWNITVLVSDDGGSSFHLLDTLMKDYTMSNWQYRSYALSDDPDFDLTDEMVIRLRSRATGGAYPEYIVRFDALSLTGNPYTTDAAVRELDIGGNQARLNDQKQVTATVKNVGSDDLTDVDVRCHITDQWGATVLNNVKTVGRLESLWERDLTWSYTPTDVARYYVNVSAEVPGDEFEWNDVASAWFDSMPLVFYEDFEDHNTDATDNSLPADSGWYLSEKYGDSSYSYYDAGAGLTSEYTYDPYYSRPIEGTDSAMLALSYYDEASEVYMDVTFYDIAYRSPLTLSFISDIFAYSYYGYNASVFVTYDGGDTWELLTSIPLDEMMNDIDLYEV
ncbi:MAG: hypothetical protein L0Z54_00750, partial [Thermoplasmata archaeon]|nr:hypothetical protein [Thermoplasmata archaeon]